MTLFITENIFAIIGGIAAELIRQLQDSKERAAVVRAFLETLVSRRDGFRILGLIARAFQNAEVRLRNEWVPIIDDVMTSSAIDFINKTNS
jgi:hypothetical protein